MPATKNQQKQDATTIVPQQNYTIPLATTRTLLFQLIVLVGNLSSSFLQHMPLDGDTNYSSNHSQPIMRQILNHLQQLTQTLSPLDLETIIYNKMELNARKYPVELCRVRMHSSGTELFCFSHLFVLPFSFNYYCNYTGPRRKVYRILGVHRYYQNGRSVHCWVTPICTIPHIVPCHNADTHDSPICSRSSMVTLSSTPQFTAGPDR